MADIDTNRDESFTGNFWLTHWPGVRPVFHIGSVAVGAFRFTTALSGIPEVCCLVRLIWCADVRSVSRLRNSDTTCIGHAFYLDVVTLFLSKNRNYRYYCYFITGGTDHRSICCNGCQLLAFIYRYINHRLRHGMPC